MVRPDRSAIPTLGQRAVRIKCVLCAYTVNNTVQLRDLTFDTYICIDCLGTVVLAVRAACSTVATAPDAWAYTHPVANFDVCLLGGYRTDTQNNASYFVPVSNKI
jgi:hypothetical protein